MTHDADLLLDSLELIAESHGDLVPLVYQRFYAQYPDTRQMFGQDVGAVHQGHMFNGLLIAVLEQAQGRCYDGSIEAWVVDHDLWGVKQAMFRAMFEALHDTVCACMGAQWHGPVAQAWRRQIDGLAARFDAACAASGLCR
jgi:hemoglobin-like flavoprotein